MRLLLPFLLLVAAGATLFHWYERRYEAEPREPAKAASTPGAAPARDDAWLRAELGQPPEAPSLLELQDSLTRWGLEETPAGWEHLLRSGAGTAARFELGRWLEFKPGERSRAVGLTIQPSGDERALDLHVQLEGPAAAVLPWLSHLLALPAGRGYWTDPQRVRLTHRGESGVGVRLSLRVLPAPVLLAGDRS